jgi:hypothetical protein
VPKGTINQKLILLFSYFNLEYFCSDHRTAMALAGQWARILGRRARLLWELERVGLVPREERHSNWWCCLDAMALTQWLDTVDQIQSQEQRARHFPSCFYILLFLFS